MYQSKSVLPMLIFCDQNSVFKLQPKLDMYLFLTLLILELLLLLCSTANKMNFCS